MKQTVYQSLMKRGYWLSSAKSIMLGLSVFALVVPCFSGATADSFYIAVKKVLSQFGRDSFRIHYLFEKDDFLHTGNLKASGWDSTVHKAWIYSPGMCEGCNQVVDLKCIGNNLTGFMIDSKKHHGDTTDIGGWEIELASGELTFLGPSSYGITGSGKTVYYEGFGGMEMAGALSRVSRRAIFMGGFNVQPVAEKETIDTNIYQDSLDNRLVCTKISSIAIGLTNNDNYFNCSSRYQGESKTIHCSTLPTKCQSDTGEMILREINMVISEYQFRFIVKNESGFCVVAIFRTRSDCESYARRCSKKK